MIERFLSENFTHDEQRELRAGRGWIMNRIRLCRFLSENLTEAAQDKFWRRD